MAQASRAQTTQQLGFDGLLAEADADNRERAFCRETAHLPGTLHVGLPFFRRLIEAHHAAMLAGDPVETLRLRNETRLLARKLNGGDRGILAGEEAPGCILARETAADPETVPLWGQRGSFVIEAGGCAVRIEMEGLFGIGSSIDFWLGFAAHAVHRDRPFISETGYRSFLGIHADPVAGMTPDRFAASVIAHHVAREGLARLMPIRPR